MKFITDFHIHSRYSVATSKTLVPEYLEYWARLKGIHVVGTGDCIHPGWLAELREKLEPMENGLWRLKKEYLLDESRYLKHPDIPDDVYFMLTGEVSTIYKKHDRVRKVHTVCVFPDFASVEKVLDQLEKVGNIRSDGRPILGLDAKILLDMTLESHELAYCIPAHIWTPWFSVLGSKSGFDSLEECYEDLTPYIHAVETGLSSDPPMNRVCSILDRFKLVSNSDAHSPEKLGREANIFDTDCSYRGIYRALQEDTGFLGTIEFFPQEGKYHLDGHRKCTIRWDPLETARHGNICPVCGKEVTRGVMYRVAQLADRSDPSRYTGTQEFYSITQLPDLIAEVLRQKSSKGKGVQKLFNDIIAGCGSEFHVLLDADPAAIESVAGDMVAEGIRRLRSGRVIIESGYDGEFGRVRVFDDSELSHARGGLFSFHDDAVEKTKRRQALSMDFDLAGFRELVRKGHSIGVVEDDHARRDAAAKTVPQGLTRGQVRAIEAGTGPYMVIAGPGSGKTRVLIERIARLIETKGVLPGNILAVTFSNKAAQEVRSRLHARIKSNDFTVETFHAFGLRILKDYFEKAALEIDFHILDEDQRLELLQKLAPERGKARSLLQSIEQIKHGTADDDTDGIFDAYNAALRDRNAIDLDDCISMPVEILQAHDDVRARYRERYQWILVDEFQDINPRQYELVSLLGADGTGNIFAIGDPDQAIYGFRGSDPRIIDRFKEDFTDVTVVGLEQSFRCPGGVISAACQVLQKAEDLSGRPSDVTIHIQETESERSEADWIARQIEMLMGGVRSFSRESGITDGESHDEAAGFSDFAVLCRSSFMFPPLAEAMANHGIPCQITETVPSYHKGPCRDIIGHVKKLYRNEQDRDEQWEGDDRAADMIRNREPLSSILEVVFSARPVDDDDARRMIKTASEYGSRYEDFFRALSLRQGVDEHDPRAEKVSLMTMHASKGLEFNTVFIPGCEQGIVPFELFGVKSPDERAEEERLLYVAMTRTKKKLYCSYAHARMHRGRLLKQKRSPFLDRIEEHLVEAARRERTAAGDENRNQLELF